MTNCEKITVGIFGGGGVGKTSISLRFANGTYYEEYTPTVEEFFNKDIEVKGKTYSLEIIDVSGQEDLYAIRHKNISICDGVILVYSINDARSVEEVKMIHEDVLNNKGKIPFVLMGNKEDLRDDTCVSIDVGKNLAENFQCMHFLSSAKNNTNIKESIQYISEKVVEQMHSKGGNKTNDKEKTDKTEGGCCNVA